MSGVSRSPEAYAARAARDAQIVQRWLGGESQADIARAFGLTHSGVHRILNRVAQSWQQNRADALRAAAAPRPQPPSTGGQTGTVPRWRGGRKAVWPDCPPELLAQYRKIRSVIGSTAAKAQLQALQSRRQGGD